MALDEKKEMSSFTGKMKNGKITGMNVKYRTIVTDGERVVSDLVGEAQPVAVLDKDPDGLDLANKIIPEINLAQQKTNDSLEEDIAEKEAQIIAKDAELAQKANQIIAKDKEIAELKK